MSPITVCVTWQVRGEKELDLYMTLVLIGIVTASIFMLATTCTVAEGMRITCTSMGLNSANNKGSNCYDKLDQRVRLGWLHFPFYHYCNVG